MVGRLRLRSFWNGPFSGDMLVFRGVPLQMPFPASFFLPKIEVQFNDLINTFQQGIELSATDLSRGCGSLWKPMERHT